MGTKRHLKYIWAILFVVAAAGFQLSNSGSAHAEAPDSGSYLLITVTGPGSTDPTALTVSAKQTVTPSTGTAATYTLNFTYNSTEKAFIPSGYLDGSTANALHTGGNLNDPNTSNTTEIDVYEKVGSATDKVGSSTVDTYEWAMGISQIHDVQVPLTAPYAGASVNGTLEWHPLLAGANGTTTSDPSTTYPFDGTSTAENGVITELVSGTLTCQSVTIADASCPAPIDISFNANGYFSLTGLIPGTYTLSASDNGVNECTPHTQYVCSSYGINQTITLTNGETDPLGTVIAGSGGQSVTQTDTGPTNSTPSCDDGGGGISWLLCPIFNGVADSVDWLMGNLVAPLLATDPVGTNASSTTYQIWSNFRVYGDIVLVIALLALVFGEVIGGGVIEAYTAKKMLPRILVAAVLINLSVYIVAIMVDLTNIVGAGVGDLLTAPLGNAAQFKFSLSGLQQGSVLAIGPSLGIGAFLIGVSAGAATLGAAIPFVLLFVVMPALFGILAAFITIILRKALILFLILVSPVAFALYCLPNTEHYFKKWWDLLFKTLLVYPIIMVIFAVADILSVTIMDANLTSGGPPKPLLSHVAGDFNSILAPLIAFACLFVPLIAIPYAFRLAGGAIGKIHETITNTHKQGQEAIKGNPNDPESLRRRSRYNVGERMLQTREGRYQHFSDASMLKEGQTRRNVRNRGAARVARVLNYGNMQAARARYNKQKQEVYQSQIQTGKDSNIRALWARKDDASDTWRNIYDGTEVPASEVAKARELARTDPSSIQSSALHELGKARNDEQLGQFKQRFLEFGTELGWNPDQANEVWKGITFPHQTDRRELKHEGIERGADGKLRFAHINSESYSDELADVVRSYDFAGLRSSSGVAALADYKEHEAYVQQEAGNVSAAQNRLSLNTYANDTAGIAARQQDQSAVDENARRVHIMSNYRETALGLQGFLSGGGHLGAEDENAPAGGYTAGGRSTGGSARSDAAWKEFVSGVLPSNGSSSGSGGISQGNGGNRGGRQGRGGGNQGGGGSPVNSGGVGAPASGTSTSASSGNNAYVPPNTYVAPPTTSYSGGPGVNSPPTNAGGPSSPPSEPDSEGVLHIPRDDDPPSETFIG